MSAESQLAAALLVPVIMVIAHSDWNTGLIRNWQNGLLAFFGLVAGWLTRFDPLDAIIGTVLGIALPLGVNILYRNLRGQDGLGYGDIKFLGAAGIWVGWQGLAPLLLGASVLGLSYGGVLFARGDAAGHTRIAFGPFLSLSLLAVWFLQAIGQAPWITV